MRPTKRICYAARSMLILALAVLAALALPMDAHARETEKIVRVGWYESPFNTTDELGRRSGYAYDYQQKIAAYTGWTYEYVTGSWPELLQMLEDGRIDLMSDISYTDERAENMLFSAQPMGTEDYYLFTAPDNKEITPEDFSTFNGRKVGANKGSVQIAYFRDWAEANGVRAEIVEMTGTEEDNITQLKLGSIDLYAALDGMVKAGDAVPACKIGSSDIFFAVSKARPELLGELNNAMTRILDENPLYNRTLYSKYLETAKINHYLSAEESAWLADHGPIRVGYRDNYLAFCAKDRKTGELTGALKDFLEAASGCLENARLEFEPVAFSTAEAAMEALKDGEVDCVFPVNLTDYDGELQGVFITPAVMRTDMAAVIRETDVDSFAKKERVAVAVNVGNPNYEMFLLDHFPQWRTVYFEDTPSCLRAIADEQADCLLISSYRFNNIAAICEKNHLTSVSTGVEMDDCLAVNRQDTLLYSVLSKVTGIVPDATINAALTKYFAEDAKTTLIDLSRKNLIVLLGVFALAGGAFLLLALRGKRAEKRAGESQRLISETEIDKRTGLYNREYFYAYAERMYRETPDRPMDAVVMSVDQLSAVAVMCGQRFEEEILRTLGTGLRSFVKQHGGISGRMDTNRFAVYCPPVEDYDRLYHSLQGSLDILSPDMSLRLKMGVAPWREDTEPARMLELARMACRRARRMGEERIVVVDEKLLQREEYDRRLLRDLNRAVEGMEFALHYQPKFDIRAETPKLVGVEALVRWHHPELGLIDPGDFLQLLERSGEIGTVDQYGWKEAARQIASWKEKYGVTVPVSVNLSSQDLFDPALKRTLGEAVRENGLSCGDLKLEIRESVCAENRFQIFDIVEGLRRAGYEIQIDNFGSGSGTLSVLSSIAADGLKLDRVLISEMEQDEKASRLVDLSLEAARYLKLPVIAVGVETEGQMRLLKEKGCAFVQGYFFSHPLSAEEFEARFLRGEEYVM